MFRMQDEVRRQILSLALAPLLLLKVLLAFITPQNYVWFCPIAQVIPGFGGPKMKITVRNL